MKICAIICEFNPFHNGHKYLIEIAKEQSGCDALLCIMSGSFTQRGELCIMDKYDRARHAVLGGADCVLELPALFSVAPAEIFARGAIKILSSVPSVSVLAFGSESGTADQFSLSADLLNCESEEFKKVLKDGLSRGESYIKSYSEAFGHIGGNVGLSAKPNNILGLEYTKAIKRANADISILPIKRIGSDYNDGNLKENFSSSSAIRRNITSEVVKDNLPPFVYEDLEDISSAIEKFEWKMYYDLLMSEEKDLLRIYGCNEGLEHKLLNDAKALSFEEIIQNNISKRYAASRIRRILCANSLGLYKDDCERFLSSDLYIKPLAVRKKSADDVLSALSQSVFPLVGFKMRNLKLCSAAEECLIKDKKVYTAWRAITNGSFHKNKIPNEEICEHMILI